MRSPSCDAVSHCQSEWFISASWFSVGSASRALAAAPSSTIFHDPPPPPLDTQPHTPTLVFYPTSDRKNVGRQHLKTVNEWPDPSRMIEAHGRLGLFKCVAENAAGKDEEGEDGDGSEGECPYSFEKDIKPADFPESVRTVLEDETYAAAASGLRRHLTDVPRCVQVSCGHAGLCALCRDGAVRNVPPPLHYCLLRIFHFFQVYLL